MKRFFSAFVPLLLACPPSSANPCGELVEDRSSGSCQCPEGTLRTEDPWTCLLPDGGTIRDPRAPDSSIDGGADAGADARPTDAAPSEDAPLDSSLNDAGCSFESRCSDGTWVFCEEGSPREENCPLGCHSDGMRCLELQPSNLPDDICAQARATPDLVVSAGTEVLLDTSTDCEVVVEQGTGPDLCVHLHRNITIASDGMVRGVVSVPTVNRALVLVAAEAFELAGRVDASWNVANAAEPSGPGRDGPGAVGTGVGVDSTTAGGGGGGASFGSRGGRSADVNAGPAGDTYGSNALVPLVGGSRGGSARAFFTALGGGGGGAVQLVGCRQMSITGVVSANGAGGQGGTKDVASPALAEGGGGGSGGAILVESPTFLELSGALVANGGGGGGAIATGGPGAARTGNAGRLDGEPAAGGTGNRGIGGLGGSLLGAATGGTSSAGGGGGAGRIRVNGATLIDLDGMIVSPEPSLGLARGH
ncbi:MAG: hypothetical protein H6722_30640 [Sandaracinus sp.]|nr:hypothetical protein [Myxococcales bacterium]MCB9616814.1 hypothetical protein [Sandaracinus sp.]